MPKSEPGEVALTQAGQEVQPLLNGGTATKA